MTLNLEAALTPTSVLLMIQSRIWQCEDNRDRFQRFREEKSAEYWAGQVDALKDIEKSLNVLQRSQWWGGESGRRIFQSPMKGTTMAKKLCEPVKLRFMEEEDSFEVEVPSIWESANFAVHECVKELDEDRKPLYEEKDRNRFFRVLHKASGLSFGTAHRQKASISYAKLAESVVGDKPSDDPLIKDFHTWMVYGHPWDFFSEPKTPTNLQANWEAWYAKRQANALARAKGELVSHCPRCGNAAMNCSCPNPPCNQN